MQVGWKAVRLEYWKAVRSDSMTADWKAVNLELRMDVGSELKSMTADWKAVNLELWMAVRLGVRMGSWR